MYGKTCNSVNLISAAHKRLQRAYCTQHFFGKSLTAALPNHSSLASRRFANIDAGGDGKISLPLVDQILTDILRRDEALKHHPKSSACHPFQCLLRPLLHFIFSPENLSSSVYLYSFILQLFSCLFFYTMSHSSVHINAVS